MVEVTEEKTEAEKKAEQKKVLYVDVCPPDCKDRFHTNKEILFGNGFLNEHKVIEVDRKSDYHNTINISDLLSEEGPCSLYVVHGKSENFKEAIDMIALSAACEGIEPKMVMIVPDGSKFGMAFMQRMMGSYGVSYVTDQIPCDDKGRILSAESAAQAVRAMLGPPTTH